MSDLVGNPEDRFSHNEAYIMLYKRDEKIMTDQLLCRFCFCLPSGHSFCFIRQHSSLLILDSYEPHCLKMGL